MEMDLDDHADAHAGPGSTADGHAPLPLVVACLCAQWCGTCRDYEPLLAELDRTLGARLTTRWIDIEDEAELVDGLDIENFPTLLIARGERVLFFGTVLPHAATLQRLAETALADELALPSFDNDETEAAVGALTQRLVREALRSAGR